MKVKPIGKNILISPIVEKGVLGTLNCEYGTVVEVGEDVKKIQVGDVIGYESDYGLNFLEVEKQKLVFIGEDSPFLLCKLEL